ncbi:MAG: HTH domain-containing protein [Promethearchaeota archaeon]
MASKKSYKKLKPEEWKNEILEFLENNPSGFTITDIAEEINSTRTTVSKYLSLLEQEKKVLSKEIGVYKLYFSAERRFMALNLFQAYYKSLLMGIKDKFSDKQDFKEIGYQICDNLFDFFYNQFPKSIRDQIKSFKDFLKFFGKVYPELDFIYSDNLTIQENVNLENEEAIYQFKNIGILDFPLDLEYHFYIISGMIERSLTKIFKKGGKRIYSDIQSIDKKNKIVTLTIQRK